MAVETSTRLDQGTLFAETVLGEDILNDLIAGEGKKKQILELVSFTLKKTPEKQAGFLKTLLRNIAIEGDAANEDSTKITNRRDAAMEILTNGSGDDIRLNEVMIPFIQANSTVVCDSYIDAVGRQTTDNNPLTGSAYALLELGKALAPHLPAETQKQQVVISAWEALANKFYAPVKHINSEIEKIKKRMPPIPA